MAISHSALNWRGDLNDLTTDQLRERADAMAWWIANNVARGNSARDAHGGINDPMEEFVDARDAWFARNQAERWHVG